MCRHYDDAAYDKELRRKLVEEVHEVIVAKNRGCFLGNFVLKFPKFFKRVHKSLCICISKGSNAH